MSITVRSLDDLERNGLAHFFYFGRTEFSSDEAFDRVQRITRVGDSLPLCDLAYESLVLIGEPDDRRSSATALFIRDYLDRAAFENGDATVRCSEIDTYYFAHT